MPNPILTIFMLCSCLVLAGCGTKGPLYIPEQRYPQKTQEQTPAPQENPSSQPTKESP
ncbi:MAG: LPS translocon maturation chaperone LptM [Methylophilaceae bacterium]